jgi:hypothetical protein
MRAMSWGTRVTGPDSLPGSGLSEKQACAFVLGWRNGRCRIRGVGGGTSGRGWPEAANAQAESFIIELLAGIRRNRGGVGIGNGVAEKIIISEFPVGAVGSGPQIEEDGKAVERIIIVEPAVDQEDIAGDGGASRGVQAVEEDEPAGFANDGLGLYDQDGA